MLGVAAAPSFAQTASSLNYAIVDTGQAKCYNASAEITCPSSGAAFYGQDAQRAVNVPSYTLSANGVTVYDNVTGLTWERSPDTTGEGSLTASDKFTYANALAHCAAHAAANYQGYNDWRLPAIKELYSLIKFNGTDPSGYSGTDTSGLTPFIDTAYFKFAYGDTSAGERIIDSQYASSTVYVDTSSATKLFGVNFADGRIKGYDTTTPGGSTKTFFVQCVRGNTSYGVNAFVDNGDQTISDSATGLQWTKSDSGVSMSWQDAIAWAQTKNSQNYLGHNDWRLPNAKELQSILDYTRSPSTSNSAAINPIFNATSFANEAGQTDWGWYWSSTTHATYNGMGASGIYLAFGRASGWQKATPSSTCYTLYDVHGAGAQRSDPKTSSGIATMGTACSGGTAYGLGPQGDVQRGVNYVRLVRDASITIIPTATATSTATNTPTMTATPTPTGTPDTKTLTLPSSGSDDGWILEKGEKTNTGGSLNSTSETLRLGDDDLKKQYRSILSFDTSSLPENSAIASVTLKLKQKSVTGSATFDMFQGLLIDIRKGTFNATGLQTTDFNASASKGSIGPFTAPAEGGWYAFDLTNAKAYLDNAGLTQLRLRFKLDDNNNATANFISFVSGDSASNKPVLIVEYYIP
jgi:hypothetical protein